MDEPPELEDRPEPEPIRSAAARQEHPQPAAPPSPVSRVHNQPVVESAEAHVDRNDILKGYEIEPDRYVTFRPREVAALRAPTSTELAITEFVQLAEIDPVFFDASYYVAPDRGGEKGYALLHRALSGIRLCRRWLSRHARARTRNGNPAGPPGTNCSHAVLCERGSG
jgi:hypothetical protein